MPVFLLYFVNYMSWEAEILQKRAEGCIQRKSVKTKIIHFYFVVLWGWFLVINSKLFN